MTYQVLARKWRPQDFSAVVGQRPIVTALSNALSEGRIAQAYLFSGIRGVGKTSVARIFAKALNCDTGPTSTPCGECVSCSEIAAGANLLDVIEVDAATYSKVEQVRELTESLRYGPARDRYKVVILDEIHRLSRQAFDALLKIVEEPPEHLVFIFATTEIESVPATILSRCQEFRFHRVSFDELSQHLERLASAETIEVGPSALRLIARASDGSVRDAVALLDQLATFGSGRIDDEAAAGVLGGVDTTLFRGLLQSILAGRSEDVVATIREIEEQGWDPRFVFTEFLHYCRNALHLALGAGPEHLDLPSEESSALASLVEATAYENLLRLLHLLLRSEETVRRSESGLLAVEVAWLRGAELPKLVEIEGLLSGEQQQAGSGTASRGSIAKESPVPEHGTAPRPVPEDPESKLAAVPIAQPEAGQHAAAPTMSTEEQVSESASSTEIDSFLSQVSRRSQALAAHLAGALGLDRSDGQLRIRVPVGDTWIQDRLTEEKHRKTLSEAVSSVWGEPARWRIVEEEAPPESKPEEVSQAIEDPQVQKILDIFGGSVEIPEKGNR